MHSVICQKLRILSGPVRASVPRPSAVSSRAVQAREESICGRWSATRWLLFHLRDRHLALALEVAAGLDGEDARINVAQDHAVLFDLEAFRHVDVAGDLSGHA